MTPCNLDNKRISQQGLSLIEAMVAALLISILFLGLAHVLARSLVSQRYMNTHNLALLEIRERIQQSGEANFCSSPGSLSWVGEVGEVGDIQLTANCVDTTVTISVGNISAQVNSHALAVCTKENNTTATQLFGGDGVIRIADNLVSCE